MKKLLLTSLLLTVGLAGCSVEVSKPKDGKIDVSVYDDEGNECNGLIVNHDITLFGSNAKGDEHIGLAC